jgi:heat shock protein HslJ
LKAFLQFLAAILLSTASHGMGYVASQSALPHQNKDAEYLSAYEWNLQQAFDAVGKEKNNWKTPDSPSIKLWFSKDGDFGTQICNSMNWKYEMDADGSLQIKPGIYTMAGCPEPLMELQKWASDLLSRKFHYTLTTAIANAPPHLQLRFADGSRWELNGEPTPITKYGSEGQPILLEVEAQHVPCNDNTANGAECLRVREVNWHVRNGKGEFHNHGKWQNFKLTAIDGYSHPPGWHGVLNVTRFKLKNPPSGEMAFAYLLQGETTRFSQ